MTICVALCEVYVIKVLQVFSLKPLYHPWISWPSPLSARWPYHLTLTNLLQNRHK